MILYKFKKRIQYCLFKYIFVCIFRNIYLSVTPILKTFGVNNYSMHLAYLQVATVVLNMKRMHKIYILNTKCRVLDFSSPVTVFF